MDGDISTFHNSIISQQCIHIMICDMIKRNESDVDNAVFEILAKTEFKDLCFMLFLALTNSS